MGSFRYPCPGCGTENNLHEFDCEWEGYERWEFEKAYIDIVSTLISKAGEQKADDRPPGVPYDQLVESVNEMLQDPPEADESDEEDVPLLKSVDGAAAVEEEQSDDPEDEASKTWSDLHNACLAALKRHGRVEERDQMGGLYLISPDEQSMGVIPLFDPIKTVFEYGPVDGCKDIAVYSMVSWCELKDLSWEGTCNFIEFWLTETGRWETEDWGEGSIEELCEAKKHVYDEEMGWGDHPEVAKGEMERSSKSRQLDAEKVSEAVDRSTFET